MSAAAGRKYTPTGPPARPRARRAVRRLDAEQWSFRLYVTDRSLRSQNAMQNLTGYCEQHFPGRYRIEVIDLRQHPERARLDNVVAVPTIVRMSPAPAQRMIGDLRETAAVLQGLR